MRRQARVVPFARRRFDSVSRVIANVPVAEWPKHLRLARNILIDELALDDATARAVLIASYCTGHACAQAINQRSGEIADLAERLKLRKIFTRVARCARRSPAPLRRILDRSVRSPIDDTIVDDESIDALIQALIAAFAKFPKEATSLTVLRAITPRSIRLEGANFESRKHLRHCFSEASALLRQDYSALRATDQRTIERTLTELRDSSDTEFHAADVCESIAGVLAGDKGVKRAIHDLITNYVVALTEIWLQHGIKPARAAHPSNRNYRGKFHHFADLVLTSAVEPWSKRHDGHNQKLSATLRKAHAQLPADIRRFVSYAPRRGDVEWLVSDDHVRAALARFKK